MMRPERHYTRWEWFDEHFVKREQARKLELHTQAMILGRTYGATRAWASTHRFWQMPRWSDDDKAYLAFLLRQSMPFEIIRYSFPDRTPQAIKNQITRLRR